MESRGSIESYFDDQELSQLLNHFVGPPSRIAKRPSNISSSLTSEPQNSHVFRTWNFDSVQAPDQKRVEFPTVALSPLSKEPMTVTATPRSVPLKAQRLMGLDSPTVYHRSAFEEWEDKEELKSCELSSQRTRLSKRDSRLFFRSPERESSFCDEGKTTPDGTSASKKVSGSKWSALSQRLRSNSTSPMVMRLRRTPSSPTTPTLSLDKDMRRGDLMLSSPTRTASMIESATSSSFPTHSHQRKTSCDEKSIGRYDADEAQWSEARASTRALRHTVSQGSSSKPPFLHDRQESPTLSTFAVGAHSTDGSRGSQSTTPLRFDPRRRPQAPFPPKEHFEPSPKAFDAPLQSPALPPCPSKMQMPSRVMRPTFVIAHKVQEVPSRPRRPTESDIFAKPSTAPANGLSSPSRLPPSQKRSRRRSGAANMTSRPPPVAPLPPIPCRYKAGGAKEAANKTTGNLPDASASALDESEKCTQSTPSALVSPSVNVSEASKAKSSFSAKLLYIKSSNTSSKVANVELCVGGVIFETQLTLLLDQKKAGDSSERLSDWLQCQIPSCDTPAVGSAAALLSVPLKSTARKSKNTINSYDNGSPVSSLLSSCSSSSDEEEREERDHGENDDTAVFAYRMSPLPYWPEEETVKAAAEGEGMKMMSPVAVDIHLASPPIRRAHVRTPTNVSLDDESRLSSQAFIFTASSPPIRERRCAKEEIEVVAKIGVQLDRDPQSYASLLHLLKHGSLPSYFTMDEIPVTKRQQALKTLMTECEWLGYDGLVSMCTTATSQL